MLIGEITVQSSQETGCVVWSLTDEGRRRQFALVQAVDGAVRDHHATYAQTVQHLSRLDQCFTGLARCKFAVRLR